jgi:DNA-binding protein HU-beta
MIKKVQTNQIVVTPNASSHVRLDELNEIMNDMESGGEAVEKMARLDEEAGLQTKKRDRTAENTPSRAPVVEPVQADETTALSDEDIAKAQLDQAKAMEAQAAQLLAESKNLTKEAYKLDPSLKPKRTVRKKATAKKKAAPKKATAKRATAKKATAESTSTEAPATEYSR